MTSRARVALAALAIGFCCSEADRNIRASAIATDVACLTEPPPPRLVLSPGDFLEPGDGACLVDENRVAACLSLAGAMAFDRALEDLRYYADNAFETCGAVDR